MTVAASVGRASTGSKVVVITALRADANLRVGLLLLFASRAGEADRRRDGMVIDLDYRWLVARIGARRPGLALGRAVDRAFWRPTCLGSKRDLVGAQRYRYSPPPGISRFISPRGLCSDLAWAPGSTIPLSQQLGRLYGHGASPAITSVTLFGGFASTVCWPLTAFLEARYGWRATCLAYALLQLLFALPVHLLALPREGINKPASSSSRI